MCENNSCNSCKIECSSEEKKRTGNLRAKRYTKLLSCSGSTFFKATEHNLFYLVVKKKKKEKGKKKENKNNINKHD